MNDVRKMLRFLYEDMNRHDIYFRDPEVHEAVERALENAPAHEVEVINILRCFLFAPDIVCYDFFYNDSYNILNGLGRDLDYDYQGQFSHSLKLRLTEEGAQIDE